MLTTEDVQTWIEKNGLENARRLCHAINTQDLVENDYDKGELLANLLDAYWNGCPGTCDYTAEQCTEQFLEAANEGFEVNTMNELVIELAPYYTVTTTPDDEETTWDAVKRAATEDLTD